MFGGESGIDQQLMDGMPRSVVSDRHCGVKDNASSLRLGTVVLYCTAHHSRIWNRDNLRLRRKDARDQQVLLDHFASRVADLNPIAIQERSHISEDDSGNCVGHCRRRTQRQQHSNKDRNSLKSGTLGARQIGKGDNECKDEHECPYQSFRRSCPIRVEPADLKVAFANFAKNQSDNSNRVGRDQDNYGDDQQVWEIVQSRLGQKFQLREDPLRCLERYFTRGRKEAESNRQISFKKSKNEQPSEKRTQCQRDRTYVSDGKMPGRLLPELRTGLNVSLKAVSKRKMHAANDPDQGNKHKRGERSFEDAAQYHPPTVRVPIILDRLTYALGVLSCKFLPGLARHFRVRVCDSHHDLAADGNLGPARVRLHDNGLG